MIVEKGKGKGERKGKDCGKGLWKSVD